MVIDFKSWKYQEIYDYIKTFENKIKCIKPIKNKLYENGFKTALLNSELYHFYYKYKKKIGVKENYIYYPTHSNTSFNIVYQLILDNYKNMEIVKKLFDIYNIMIYIIYFYDSIKNHNLIENIENGILNDLNFNKFEIIENLKITCDEINNIKEFLTEKTEVIIN